MSGFRRDVIWRVGQDVEDGLQDEVGAQEGAQIREVDNL